MARKYAHYRGCPMYGDHECICVVRDSCHPARDCREAKVEELVEAAGRLKYIIENTGGVRGWAQVGHVTKWKDIEDVDRFLAAAEALDKEPDDG